MANILLIEPDYKCKQPPLGLMKISFFHKKLLHDYVRFAKGRFPDALSWYKGGTRIYVTSLLILEWKVTIEAIEYAKTLVDSIEKIVGGWNCGNNLQTKFLKKLESALYAVC